MIGIVTFIAWTVINRTVLEQFRTAELQLVTSLSQQVQASLNTLNGDIVTLGLQDEIRATSATREEQARVLLAEEAASFPPGAILSITRFDFRGDPRYAWPENLDREINDMGDTESYPYRVPESLVELTRRGQRVTSEIDVRLHTVSHRDGGITTLLIAPVDSVGLDTEFIVYEIDLEPLLAELFSFVDLGDSGQLWVMDGVSNVLYQARPSPELSTTYDSYSSVFLRSVNRPFIDTYEDDSGRRQAAIANADALAEEFVIFLSRSEGEAQEGVTQNVVGIFAFSVVAMLLVVGLGSAFAQQITRVNESRREEIQRRETARILLDVSQAISSSLEISVVLERILDGLGRLVPHDSASVLLLDRRGFQVAATSGSSGQTHIDYLELDQARAVQKVVDGGEPMVIADVSQDPLWTDVPGVEIASWMGLPLRVREQSVGVLNVNSMMTDRFTPDDIEVAQAFADQASVALQNARLHELEVKQIEQELSIAHGIQASLMPSTSPDVPELEIVARSLSARQVSGDFFQYLTMPDGSIGIAVGDVQGKGIPAALLMAVITTAMRDEILRHHTPAALLGALNERLLDRMQQNHMTTALMVANYHPATGELSVANSGMVQPYVRMKKDEAFDFVQVGGYPMGISENMEYNEKSLMFESGSLMVMFTDGVLEAQNSKGEFFGFERLEELLVDLPDDVTAAAILERMFSALEDHLGDEAPQDDTTIMVLRGLQDPVGTSTQPAAALHLNEFEGRMTVDGLSAPALISTLTEGTGRKNIELFLPSSLGFEKIARGTVEALAREMGFSDGKIEDLKTAVSEACMNAIEHGNGADETQPVSVLMSASSRGIEVRVTDRGMRTLSPDLPEPGVGDMRGWGLYFIKNLVDVFEIKHLPEGGNQVLMVNYLRRDSDFSEHGYEEADSESYKNTKNTNGNL
jgi:serine phosphatase RsbU (regulator of sigma subunit)/anti-sigma regulatory factor (Ser/Thr protein kinase)